MRVIIAGSRDLDPQLVAAELPHAIEIFRAKGYEITEVVSGHSGTVDLAGEAWAEANGIPVKTFPYPRAFGRRGGPIRNGQMAQYAEALITLRHWGGASNGTDNMIRQARKHNLIIQEGTL